MAAKDVLKTIRSKVKHRTDSFTSSQLESDAAAKELKDEYEIRKRIQIGRWRDRQRRMSKQKQGISFDSVYSESSPGTSRIEGTQSSLTSRSHVLSEESPSPKPILDTRSPTGSEKEKRERIRNRWKRGKVPSVFSVMDQYRERLKAEKESGLDLLETIRILRGISKEEFYDDDEMKRAVEEKESQQVKTIHEETEKLKKYNKKKKKVKIKNDVDIFNVKSPVPILPKLFSQNDKKSGEVMDDSSDNEILRPLFENPENDSSVLDTERDTNESEPEIEISVRVQFEFPSEKDENIVINPIRRRSSHNIGCRIDSRWPEGHRLHTKPINDPDLSLCYSSKQNLVESFGEGMASIFSAYRGNQCYSYSDSERKLLPLINNKKSKVRELFEDWRTEMMKVAYDEEFASKHKINKRFSYPVLPSLTSAPKDNKLPPLKNERAIPESVAKVKAPINTVSKHWNKINKEHVGKKNKHKSNNHTKDDYKITQSFRENVTFGHTNSDPVKKNKTYLPEFSCFLDNVEITQNKNIVVLNDQEDQNVATLNRNSPSTDSAINEPNSDSENDQDDDRTMIQLPPISLQVKGVYKIPDGEDQQHSSPKSKKQARSRSLIGIQQLLDKEPTRNERIRKLFDTLQENRPESQHRKKRRSRRKKHKNPDANKPGDKDKITMNKSNRKDNETINVKQSKRKKEQSEKIDREFTEFFKIEDRDGQIHVESEARDPVTLISMSKANNES